MIKLARIALVLIVILLIAFTVFWFARAADVNFDEARSALPNADYSRFAEIDGVRKINKIRRPTLIIWGAEDELIPLEAGRRLNTLIAGSRLVVFDKCGHVPQAEMPERFVGEVRGFVTSPTGTSNQIENN